MNRILLAFAVLIAAPAIVQEAAPKPPTVLGPKTVNGTTIDTVTGPAKYRYPKKYDGYVLKDYTVVSKGFGLRNNDGSSITVEGGNWRHTGAPSKISASFALGGSGTMTLNNVAQIGSYDPKVKVGAGFENTDGVMGAQRTTLIINGGSFAKAWDAGIDTKATTTMTGTVTVEDSRVSLKVWGPLVGDTLVSRNPRDGHVACLKSPVVTCGIYLRKLIAWDDNPNGLLVGFQGNDGVVRIDECELHVPTTYRVSWIKPGSKNTKLILGPTCVKDGKLVVAPAKPIAASPAAQIGFDLGVVLPNHGDGDGAGIITLTTAKTIAERNAYLEAHGSAIVLKKGDHLIRLGGTIYKLVN